MKSVEQQKAFTCEVEKMRTPIEIYQKLEKSRRFLKNSDKNSARHRVNYPRILFLLKNTNEIVMYLVGV